MSLHRLAGIVALANIASVAAAQQVVGTVRDSASGLPVHGAVVLAEGARGTAAGRNITDQRGRFVVGLNAPAERLRVLRLGFRPREVVLSPGRRPQDSVDVALVEIPTLLERVRVTATAAACPRRTDALDAAALLDQARAGLLATVVARESSPARVTRLAYDRTLDANGLRTVSQTVRMETADRATVSFNAVQAAVDFARLGFVTDTGANRTFLGPDADVLLDENFVHAYCFRIADPVAVRANQVGLGFSPASRRNGRVDIEGALWVDTVARKLVDIEFRYRGVDQLSEGLESGGRVWFREVASGITLIDHWSLRLIAAADTGGTEAAGQTAVRAYTIHEVGGELAKAVWPDGRSWTAPLGTLRLAARARNGAPATGSTLGLAGTDYQGVVDSSGLLEIRSLVPGPYSIVVVEPRLATIGITLPTELSFAVTGDSVVSQSLVIPTAEEFVADACRAVGRPTMGGAWLIGRVASSDGRPVAGAKWSLEKSGEGGWIPVTDGGSTGSSGIFSYCRNLATGQSVQLRIARARKAPTVIVRPLSEQLTVLRVRLASAPAARARATGDLVGIVVDSSTRQGVAGAFVELVGTTLRAMTDSSGAFTIANVARGEYAADIRSATLDSLGAVGRSGFDFTGGSIPVRLYVPTVRELSLAMCGPGTRAGTAMLFGTVRMPDGAPPGRTVRMVAEFSSGADQPGQAARADWLRVRTDAEGTFRLCGVPSGSVVLLRTQVDSGSTAAAAPRDVRLAADQQFARVDVTLEPGLILPAAFAGVVVADSTDAPIPGVEIILPNLSRSVLTNGSGAFRVDDIPPGVHKVVIRGTGLSSITAELAFGANQTLDQHVVLGRAMTALAPVQVNEVAPSVNRSFDEARKLGLGKFLTRDELAKHAGRKLADVLATVPSMGSVTQGSAGHGWIVGKRVPARLAPRGGGLVSGGVNSGCGPAPSPAPGAAGACVFDADMLRDQGFYCPQAGEELRGITCACYAQVYLDGRLMNHERPTEPFDINSMPPETLEGIEWYASPSQTPAQYSNLNSPCGVMVLWTRRSH